MSPHSSGPPGITVKPAADRALQLGRQWRQITHPLRLACIIFPALLFCGLAWIDYREELRRTQNDVRTTTNAVAEHARTVIETTSLVVARVLEHIDQQDWAFLSTSLETHEFLDHLRHELPQIEAVYLVDPDGVIAASSRAYPMPRYDVHRQEYFAAAKLQNNDSLVITAPFPGTMSGTTGFMVSRRRVQYGKFDGVVGVTVSRKYFENFYAAILDDPTASAAGIIRTDGAVLIRVPGSPVTVVPAFSPVMAAIRAADESGLFSDSSGPDGSEHIAGFRKLHDLPLVAGYEIDRSLFLWRWAIHAAVIGVCAMLLSILLLATEHLVRRNAAVEHDALGRLLEETERRRQAEVIAQQSQKMDALGRLTGGVAHDFNNLLAVILGSLELVLRREKDSRSRRLLEAATKAAERGAKLTAQMLAFSRKHEVAARPVDANSLIRSMHDLLRRTLGPSIKLHYALAGDLWPALADPVQLEMALLNLAVNARDAMPGGGDLTFRTSTVVNGDADGLAPGDYVCVRVVDTGVGMAEEVRRRAHEPFFTTKGPGGGTGLGLSMVSGFATELGGALTLESSPGVGTTVSLFLRKADHSPDIGHSEIETAVVSAGAVRVLLVDDDTSVRASVRAMLEELGHEVVEATGGAETLDVLARDQHFDLLIIDFAMPSMNGAQLAAEVTKLWSDAPMLFVTGYVENDALRPWADRGYWTVQKPFTTRELSAAIEGAVRRPETAAI